MKFLFTGSRDWTDRFAVEHAISRLPKNAIVIHGGARGLDTIAGKLAHEAGHTVRVYPANWEKWGLAAGPIRNREMLAKENTREDPIVRVFAFHFAGFLEGKSGTLHMIEIADLAGIPIILTTVARR